MQRLLVVEKDGELCDFLEKNLSDSSFDVEQLVSIDDFPRALERNAFHLIVLGIHLGEDTIFYWLKWLKSYYPATPVIATAIKVQPKIRLETLVAGAYDYLTAPLLNEELLIKINSYFKYQNREFHSSLMKIGDCTVDPVNVCIVKNGKSISLTKLECKILQLFYINVGIPLSREDLMWQTMGIRYVPSNRSIDTHINRIRMKIEDTPCNPTYIRTVRGRGYCFHLPEQ